MCGFIITCFVFLISENKQASQGMDRMKTTWSGDRPPSSINQVWVYVAFKLRQAKDSVRKISEEFYSRTDSEKVIKELLEALKCFATDTIITNVEVMQTLLQNWIIDGNKKQKTKTFIQEFSEKLKHLLNGVRNVLQLLKDDIVPCLQSYCSGHVTLGLSDDCFFRDLHIRAASLDGMLKKLSMMTDIIYGQKTHTYQDLESYFSDEGLSFDISLKHDCHTFPIIRAVPDILQKLDGVMGIIQDWLRSDKVYLQEVEKCIEDTKKELKSVVFECQHIKLEKQQHFAKLRTQQMERENDLESNADVNKHLKTLESKKVRLEIEISATKRTLMNCKEQLEDIDEIDGNVSTDNTNDNSPFQIQNSNFRETHESYRRHVSKDERILGSRLLMLHSKMSRWHKSISILQGQLQQSKSRQVEIEQISKKLKNIGKRKIKLETHKKELQSRVEFLSQVLHCRQRPCSTVYKPPPPGYDFWAHHLINRSKDYSTSLPGRPLRASTGTGLCDYKCNLSLCHHKISQKYYTISIMLPSCTNPIMRPA